MSFYNLTLTGTRDLHMTESDGSAAAVIAKKIKIPEEQEHCRA